MARNGAEAGGGPVASISGGAGNWGGGHPRLPGGWVALLCANRRSMPNADASKWTSTDEVARVVLFLASPESAPVNGAAVPVYGRS